MKDKKKSKFKRLFKTSFIDLNNIENFEFDVYLSCLLGIFLFIVGLIILHIKHLELTSIFPAPCAFYNITHFYCPGCGGTRAVKYLIQGDIIKSIQCNPFVLYSFVLVGYFTIRYSIYLISKKKIRKMNFKFLYIQIDIIILLAQWVIKNILLYFYNIHIPD